MRALAILPLLLLASTAVQAQPAGKAQSHPPLRTVPPVERPLDKGPAYFVDARGGDDKRDGSKAKPWRTVTHALRQLQAGDTLYLRGGVYYEHVIVSRLGRAGQPITLRSFPGEQAILDGGLREFFETPAQAWESVDKNGEYRSTRTYPNIRDVMGLFGDSMIGLNTYHHAKDLRAAGETWEWDDPAKSKETDVRPVYCGPGLWYDDATGRIHARLAHTHLADIANYQGATDPRKLPLVVAPFRSVPLLVDGARHVRFQDLVIRGGGYDTVVLKQCADVEFDNVTVFCGTYGMRATGAQRLKLWRCGLHGSVPPWVFRTDTSLRTYPGKPYRDITRFGTHALLVPEGGREFEVFSLPINDDWEIAYCDFTDGHDGLYLGGVNVRFHHNHVYDLQDDGIYLSPMYSRVGRGKAALHLYQNLIGRSLTALAFGGPEKVNEDTIHFYRNVVDLREHLQTGRPTGKDAKPRLAFGHAMGDHGSPPYSTMRVYHNTFVAHGGRRADMSLTGAASAERPRRVFNNLLVHIDKLPALNPPLTGTDVQADGNLYWSPGLDAKKGAAFFTKLRASAVFEKSKQAYPPGFEGNSRVGDPRFVKFAEGPGASNDYRLADGSAALGAGVELPAEWADPLRKAGRPDIGAAPAGDDMPRVGRFARP